MRFKAQIGIIAVACLAIAVLFFVQQRRMISLQEQLATLNLILAASESERQKAESTEQTRAAALECIQQSELPQLRGEVSMLRRQLAEKTELLENVKKESSRAPDKTTSAPVATAFGGAVSDLGASTPERAAVSLIWAATSGQKQRLSELLELPANVTETDAPGLFDYFANALSNKFLNLVPTEVTSIRPNPDGSLRLGIVYRDPQTGKTNPFPFMMRRSENNWKVVVESDEVAEVISTKRSRFKE